MYFHHNFITLHGLIPNEAEVSVFQFSTKFVLSSGAKLLDLTVAGICASIAGAKIPKCG